jgi:hypothetical protein
MPTKPKKPRKEPAERVLIIDEWDEWAKGKVPDGEKGTHKQGLEFHDYLGREKPRLLEFKYAGNRWQQVKVWLREFERIHDERALTPVLFINAKTPPPGG